MAFNIEVLLYLSVLFTSILLYFKYRYRYWAKKGVYYLEPKFPLGNNNTYLPRGLTVGIITKKYYDELKKAGQKFGGVYLVTEPNLVVIDLEYIKDILTKDFIYFVDRGFYYNEEKDPISAHLFAIDGAKWKTLRTKLTPTFTSGKIKMMFQNVVECSTYMKSAMDKYASDGVDIEIKDVLGCFTTDSIGSVAFGIECNSFTHPNAEFRQMGRQFFEYSIWKAVKAFFIVNTPKLSLQLGISPNSDDVKQFFRKIVKETVEIREKNNISRNDLLQILIDLKNDPSVINSKFTIDEMAAQTFGFFVAGFETSATAMTFALYELARDEAIQTKLRNEINQVLAKHNNILTYDNLKEMKYLAQVLDESMRKYPPVPVINRRCTKDYKLRDTDIIIEKATPILISTMGLHHDPEYFPNPEIFDPDRFTDEMKQSRHPYSYLPFGDGPRNCIALRFGQMQSRIGVATIIKNFKLSVSPNCKPVELNPYAFLLRANDEIILRAEKI